MNRTATTHPSASASPRAPALPATSASALGEFTATALLHEGPWSNVYRVRPAQPRPTQLDAGSAPYALKIPPTKGQNKLVAENMLRREIRVMQSVSQPNLVALLDYGLDERHFYLLTPYLEGATMGGVFTAGLCCPTGHALWVARQTAQALAALHAEGWRHGDVKPDNIHVSPSGHTTLLDLGLAQRLDAPEMTPNNVITGALAYMAPECFQGTGQIGIASDIYSLGAILFQMIAGRPPFVSPNAASLVEAHLSVTPPDLPLQGFPAAHDVQQLVARMLAKDPLRRPQSASDLAQRLMRLEIATLDQRVAA